MLQISFVHRCCILSVLCMLVLVNPNNEVNAQSLSSKLSGRVPSPKLAANPSVIRELNLSELQKKEAKSIVDELNASLIFKVRQSGSNVDYYADEVQILYAKAHGDWLSVLDNKQKKRMQEIYLQVNGADALLDRNVAISLKLTDEQKSKIKSVRSEIQKAVYEVLPTFQSQGEEEYGRKIDGLIERREKTLNASLTAEQRDAYEKLKGVAFKLEADLSDPENMAKYLRSRMEQQSQNALKDFTIRMDPNRFQSKSLIKSLLNSSDSPAISSPFDFDGTSIRRVLVAERSCSGGMLWESAGNNLYLLGSHLTRIEYPNAKSVEAFELERPCEFVGLSGDEILLAVADGQRVGMLNPKLLQINPQLTTSNPAVFFGSANPKTFYALLKSHGSNALYLCSAKEPTSAKPIELTDQGKPLGQVSIRVSSNGKSIFACGENVVRFSMNDGLATCEESVVAPWVSDELPEILEASEGGFLTVVTNRKLGESKSTAVTIFDANNLSQSQSLEVADLITCACFDATRKRQLLGGLNGLWEWRPGGTSAMPISFPRHLPSIRSIALHPAGKTLAVLCGSGPQSRLFFVELN